MKIKYANYTIVTDNIGDNAQVYALDKIYERMGIMESEIVHFHRENVLDRIREDCHYILPMVIGDGAYYDLLQYLEELELDKRFSFVPISLGQTRWIARNEKGLGRFRRLIDRFEMPIGCRDFDSAELYSNLGYTSYVSGCITNTFSERPRGGGQWKH